MNKLILIGPLTYLKEPSKTGGAIVQFETIVEGLNQKKVPFEIIDTNKLNYSSKISALLRVSWQYSTKVKRRTKVLYFTSTNYKFFLPIFFFIRLFKPHRIILRKIGGDLVHDYSRSLVQKTYISALLNKVDIILTESSGLEKFLLSKGFYAQQFLNARKKPKNHISPPKSGAFKIVYIGRLARTKGVQKLKDVSKLVDDTTTIEVYGPIENVPSNIFYEDENIHYRESFNNDEIYAVLNQYDAVILPSEFRGEGHPGILIEALMAGKPVIATDINYNSELIKDGYNGLLIKDNSVNEIVKGINRLKNMDYEELSRNALESSAPFDIDSNIDKIITLIEELD